MNISEKNTSSGPSEENTWTLQQERLALEQERLALERERLAEREKRLDEWQDELAGSRPGEVAFSRRFLTRAAIALFVLGLIAGLGPGIEWGRRQSPKPQRVLVSRDFVSMMNKIRGVKPVPFDQEKTLPPRWMDSTRSEFPEDLIILR